MTSSLTSLTYHFLPFHWWDISSLYLASVLCFAIKHFFCDPQKGRISPHLQPAGKHHNGCLWRSSSVHFIKGLTTKIVLLLSFCSYKAGQASQRKAEKICGDEGTQERIQVTNGIYSSPEQDRRYRSHFLSKWGTEMEGRCMLCVEIWSMGLYIKQYGWGRGGEGVVGWGKGGAGGTVWTQLKLCLAFGNEWNWWLSWWTVLLTLDHVINQIINLIDLIILKYINKHAKQS